MGPKRTCCIGNIETVIKHDTIERPLYEIPPVAAMSRVRYEPTASLQRVSRAKDSQTDKPMRNLGGSRASAQESADFRVQRAAPISDKPLKLSSKNVEASSGTKDEVPYS